MAKSAEGHRSRGFLGTLLILLLPFLAIDEFAEFLGLLGLMGGGGEARGERPEGTEEAARNIFLVGCLLLLVLVVSPFGIVFLGSAWLALKSGYGLLGAIKMGLLGDVGLIVFFAVWTIKKRRWDPAYRARNRVKLIVEDEPDLRLDELVERARKVLGKDDAWARQLADDAASEVFRRHLQKKEKEERRRQQAAAQGQRRGGWRDRLRRWMQTADRFRVPPPPPRRRR